MDVGELVQQVGRQHRTNFTLLKRYEQGEQGAFALLDPEGQQYVLKWSPGTARLERWSYIQNLTNNLHTRGYPAPTYTGFGALLDGTYTLQTTLPGTPLGNISKSHLTRLLELNALQRVQALADDEEWPREVVQTVLLGGQGYCQHDSLLHYSTETARMLSSLQQIVEQHHTAITVTDNIVHFDFQHANILHDEETITGVIDWDGVCAGDATFDLVTLLFYAYEEMPVREDLWQYILQQTTLPIVSVYLAHLILRQVDWSLRHHDRAIGERYITRSRQLLQRMAQNNIF